MPVEEELARFSPKKDMALTIGVFDGLHLGHKTLISKLVSEATQKRLLSGVVTFKTHPRDFFQPETRLPFLTTIDERIHLLKAEGVDEVIALSFTREMAVLAAREFLALLQKYLRIKALVIGPDTTVGKNREGTVEVIKQLGAEMGFSVTIVPPKKVGGETVSSTAIRQAITAGDMDRVARLLGRYFSLQGNVGAGAHRGTGMGFPTANIHVDARQALPPDGVYATWAYVEGKGYESMTNIGKRPTFGAHNRRTIEVYILNYDKDIYGKPLKIELVERLRGEQKFENPEALKRQIAEDVKRGKEILSNAARK